MEAQQERRTGTRRGPDKRCTEQRRIGKGRRIWNRRIDAAAVDDDHREAVRRTGGSPQRSGAMRRASTRRDGDRRIA